MVVLNNFRFVLVAVCLASIFSLCNVLAQDMKVIGSASELIAAANEGGTYELAVGRYELDETLLVERDLSLLGAGIENTIIVTKADPIGLSVQGDISVSFEGITFQHEGDAQEDVVEIKDANFLIKSCKFTGGVFQEVEEGAEFVYGAGLWLHGTAKGEIYDSEFVDNDANGINISGEVELRLEQSTISNNGWEGILILGNGKVSANDIIVESNVEEGIALNGNSYLYIANSSIQANQEGGLWLYSDSSADISNTNFVANKTFAGLGVTDAATVRAIDSQFYDHEVASIYIYADAAGTISSGYIEDNETGVAVADNAKVHIKSNIIAANTDAINVFDDAFVTITDNGFVDVLENGISIFDNSYASVRNNEYYGDVAETLFSAYDNTSAYIADNFFDYTEVSLAQIYVEGTSKSTIVGNLFTNNDVNPGIDVAGEASATIRDNIISANAYGVVARGDSVAKISQNIFEDNGYSILAYGKSQVIASDNIMDYGENSAVALREESQLWLRDTSIQYAGDAAVDVRGSSRAGLFNNDLSFSESFGIYGVDKAVVYANKNFVGENYNSGVYVADDTNVAVIDNVFEYHYEYGVELGGATEAVVAYNYFENNYIGLGFRQSASRSINNNDFTDNTTDISRIK